MNGKQQPGRRRRRSQAEVEGLVAEYEASGLGRQAFCNKHGLSLSTLNRHRKRQQTASGLSTGPTGVSLGWDLGSTYTLNGQGLSTPIKAMPNEDQTSSAADYLALR